ncbi:MAG: hypothetical protein HQL61_07740 [Magnetococcales bacterium]|nr:hypothetical protein [Nitrospirota bacterium]
MTLKLDEIGFWSETKLDIIKKYASAYVNIMKTQSWWYKGFVYIDAFAGAGKHISKHLRHGVISYSVLLLFH